MLHRRRARLAVVQARRARRARCVGRASPVCPPRVAGPGRRRRYCIYTALPAPLSYSFQEPTAAHNAATAPSPPAPIAPIATCTTRRTSTRLHSQSKGLIHNILSLRMAPLVAATEPLHDCSFSLRRFFGRPLWTGGRIPATIGDSQGQGVGPPNGGRRGAPLNGRRWGAPFTAHIGSCVLSAKSSRSGKVVLQLTRFAATFCTAAGKAVRRAHDVWNRVGCIVCDWAAHGQHRPFGSPNMPPLAPWPEPCPQSLSVCVSHAECLSDVAAATMPTAWSR